MKTREQVIFDVTNEKFRYLQRDENKTSKKVDVNELNKRLNQTKKINFYYNTKIVFGSLMCLIIISLISLNF